MNYKIVIFFVLLCSPSVIDVFGQESSRNLTAEYCANNWKLDPVRCSEYVPKNYQPSQSQAIFQSNVKANNAGNCPPGTHYGTDAYGPTCITNQIVSSSSSNVQNNSSPSNSPPNSPFIWVGIVMMFVVVVLVKIFRRGSSTPRTTGEYTRAPLPRRSFSKDVQHQTLMRQGGKCAMCGEFSKTWDADHKNGDRSDDSPYNCQMLCPNCHTYKSRRSQMGLD